MGLRSRAIAIAFAAIVIAGFFLLFPGIVRRSIRFDVQLTNNRCAKTVELAISRDGVRERSLTESVRGRPSITYDCKLHPGEILLTVDVICDAGAVASAPHQQPVIIDRDGTVPLVIPRLCACP